MLLFEDTTSITSDATSEATSETGSFDWATFWKSIGDFFIKDDGTGTGTGYLIRVAFAIVIIILSYFVIKLLMAIIKKAMGLRKRGPEIDVSAKWFIANVIKVIMWIGVAFLVVAILNINITGFAGVASAITVALGLALQDVIGCWASGIIILNQKHIRTGDYISIKNGLGESEGTVTKISFLMTYLKTPNGQEVTVPNNNVQKAIVTNFTKLGKRRLNYDVGVAYNTDIELAKKVLLSVVKGDKRVLKDEECVVYVYELGAYSVGLRLRLWTKVDDYWSLYNELSEKILLAFNKNNIYIPSSTDIAISQR